MHDKNRSLSMDMPLEYAPDEQRVRVIIEEGKGATVAVGLALAAIILGGAIIIAAVVV